MRKFVISLFLAPVLVLTLLSGGYVLAGGLQEIPFDPEEGFDQPTIINNEHWPQIPGTYFVYFAETEDGCEWNIVDVTYDEYEVEAGVTGVVVLDMEWEIEPEEGEECTEADYDGADYAPADPFNPDFWPGEELTEMTYDWYAQDDLGNVWYLGEATWSFPYEEDDCESEAATAPTGEEGCMDGSFEAGTEMTYYPEMDAQAGIVMLAEPEKGAFYPQELDLENAEDWAKVLNFVPLDEEESCLKTKEWTPLEPGSVEHKYYCPGEDGQDDGVLLLIEENSGGPKVFVELLYVGTY